MDKKEYITPTVEIITFQVNPIICQSVNSGAGMGDLDDDENEIG